MQNNYLNYLCYCYANSLFSGPLIIRILNSTGLGVESYNFPSNIFLNCQISSKTNLWWNSYISNINLKLSKTIINTISMKSSDFLNTFTWKILLFMFWFDLSTLSQAKFEILLLSTPAEFFCVLREQIPNPSNPIKKGLF